MSDFPEPKSWNGDEDDRDGGFINRFTGGRLDLGVCYECGREIGIPISLSWLGVFCSQDCATKASERHAAAMDPRRV